MEILRKKVVLIKLKSLSYSEKINLRLAAIPSMVYCLEEIKEHLQGCYLSNDLL